VGGFAGAVVGALDLDDHHVAVPVVGDDVDASRCAVRVSEGDLRVDESHAGLDQFEVAGEKLREFALRNVTAAHDVLTAR
jgi:hypothetical protein